MRNCNGCNGTGKTTRAAFSYEGRTYPEKTSRCISCEGRGQFPEPDKQALLDAIKGRKGLRSAAPDYRQSLVKCREYYVWRMARFHGGVDMTMPMTAGLMSRNDPYRDELDQIADEAARLYFGSDLRAASRWGRALGMIA